MNDFTKEELKEILSKIQDWYEEIEDLCEPNPILHKIQSMIDNYCEHDWENICCQCAMDQIYCHKCEKRFNEI